MHGEKRVVVVTFSIAMRNSVLKQLLEGCVCLGLFLRASPSRHIRRQPEQGAKRSYCQLHTQAENDGKLGKDIDS